MSRPLRFRAWDASYQEMVVRDDWADCIGGWLSNPDVFDVMQATGMTDKTGAEIFEGDILLERGEKFEWHRPVVWHQGGWAYSIGKLFRDAPDRSNPLHYNCASMEVVGNVHETPELLDIPA